MAKKAQNGGESSNTLDAGLELSCQIGGFALGLVAMACQGHGLAPLAHGGTQMHRTPWWWGGRVGLPCFWGIPAEQRFSVFKVDYLQWVIGY